MILQNVQRRVAAVSYSRMRTGRWLPFAILAAVTGMAAPAGDKPNLTGVWELTTVERDGMTLPAGDNTFGETQVWSHDGPKLTIKMTTRSQGKSSVTQLSYTLDGKIGVVGYRVRADKGNPPINGSAHWDGDRLVYEQEFVDPAPTGIRRIVRTCSLGERAQWLTCEQLLWMAGSDERREAKWKFEKAQERP
jgi:hypothetical protein